MSKLTLRDSCDASVARGAAIRDAFPLRGIFHAEHIRDGKVIWQEDYPNTVVTTGVDAMFDAALAGSAYTVTGPYMGLISSTGFTGIVNGDTMSAHPGWNEAGLAHLPHYTAPRKTCVWSAAAARTKALSAGLAFTITADGTAKGTFIVFGAGAVSTIDSAAGTLFAAGLFLSGDRAVIINDVLTCSYSISA